MALLLFYAAVLPCVLLAEAYILRRYPTPGVPRAALAAVAIAFAAALAVTLLAPVDVYWLYSPGGPTGQPSREAASARAALAIWWNATYWTSVAATVILPLLQARRARL